MATQRKLLIERFKRVPSRQGTVPEEFSAFDFLPNQHFLGCEWEKYLKENPHCPIKGCLCGRNQFCEDATCEDAACKNEAHKDAASSLQARKDAVDKLKKLKGESDIYPEKDISSVVSTLGGILYGDKTKQDSVFFNLFPYAMESLNKHEMVFEKCRSVLSPSQFHHLMEFLTFFDEVDAVVNRL